jgi:hypothetical protein
LKFASGKNDRLQHPAAALIHESQPGDLLSRLQTLLVGGIHLPDFMGLLGSG